MNKTVYAVILCSALATGSSYSMGVDENSGGGIEATVAALRAEIQELRGANDHLNDKWIALNGLIATFGVMTDPAIKQVEHLTEWATSQEQQVKDLKKIMETLLTVMPETNPCGLKLGQFFVRQQAIKDLKEQVHLLQ